MISSAVQTLDSCRGAAPSIWLYGTGRRQRTLMRNCETAGRRADNSKVSVVTAVFFVIRADDHDSTRAPGSKCVGEKSITKPSSKHAPWAGDAIGASTQQRPGPSSPPTQRRRRYLAACSPCTAAGTNIMTSRASLAKSAPVGTFVRGSRMLAGCQSSSRR